MKQLSQPKPESTEGLLKVEGETVKVDRGGLDKAFGSTNPAFIDGLVHQIVNIGSQGPKPDDKGMAYVASIIASIEPRDEMEALLAAQMAAVHNASMTFARRLAHVDTIQKQDSRTRLQQAMPHLHGPARSPEAIPDGRHAEDDSRARPRASRRPGHCRRRPYRGAGRWKKLTSTP